MSVFIYYRFVWDRNIISIICYVDNVWIGLECDLLVIIYIYKWIDGNFLVYVSFGIYFWRDEIILVDDLSKICIRLDWGLGLLFKFDVCN